MTVRKLSAAAVLATMICAPWASAEAAGRITWSAVLRNDASAPGSRESLRKIEVTARHTGGGAEPVKAEATVPGTGVFRVPAGTWEVTAAGAGLWFAPRYAAPGDELLLDGWPTGALLLELRKGTRDSTPERLTVRFRPATQKEGPEGSVTCHPEKALWRCELPVGIHDLTVIPTPYVPVSQWSVAVAEDGVPARVSADLRRGGAVVGSVELQQGVKVPYEAVVVTLTPLNVPSDSLRAQNCRATPNRRGYFQCIGVAPGDYTATAAAKGLISDARQVRVLRDSAALLNAPLVLGPPRRLALSIVPPVDPSGMRWNVSLLRLLPGSQRHYDEVTQSNAAETGLWTHAALPDGQYRALVRDSKKQTWSDTIVQVAGGDVVQPIDVHAVAVSGKVTRGGEPLAATIVFGGEHGRNRHTLHSTEDGTFRGLIGAAPGADHVWDILLESETPPVRRLLRGVQGRERTEDVWYDVEVQSTLLRGSVEHADGKAEPHPIVHVRDGKTNEMQTVTGEADGTFVIAGFEPGEYAVQADGYLAKSDVVNTTIGEDAATDLKLVLEPAVVVQGRVVTNGIPVPGASVIVIPRQPPVFLGESAQSDERGLFTLILPPGTKTYDVLVSAPGLSLVMARMQVENRLLEADADQRGGELVATVSNVNSALLVHAGAQFPLGVLATAGRATVRHEADRVVVSIPLLEAGEYSVCDAGACKSAYVGPFGRAELHLSK